MSQGATPDSSYSPPSLSFPPLKFSPAQKIAVKFLYLTSKSIDAIPVAVGEGDAI